MDPTRFILNRSSTTTRHEGDTLFRRGGTGRGRKAQKRGRDGTMAMVMVGVVLKL